MTIAFPAFATLATEVDGETARITIQRPDVLNALNQNVIGELRQAVALLKDAFPAIRAVVLAGAGEKAFVAGADIAAMRRLSPEEAKAFARQGQQLTEELEALPQVTIARVQGFALGGGCELALACDVIVASKKAKFGQPETNLGLVAGFGGTQRFARRTGLALALDVLLTGRMLSGEEAAAAGLAARVTEPDQLDNEIKLVLKGILRGGPNAIAATKKLVRTSVETPLAKGLETEAAAFATCFSGSESQDGMGAFLEKRPASFARP